MDRNPPAQTSADPYQREGGGERHSPFIGQISANDILNPVLQPLDDILPQTRTIVHLKRLEPQRRRPTPTRIRKRSRAGTPGARTRRQRRRVRRPANRIPSLHHLHEPDCPFAMRITVSHPEHLEPRACPRLQLVHIVARRPKGRQERLEGRSADMQTLQVGHLAKEGVPRYHDAPRAKVICGRRAGGAVSDGEVLNVWVMRAHDEADDVFFYRVACFNVDGEVSEGGESERVNDLREEVVSTYIQFG